MKNTSKVLTVMAAGLAVAIAGCNESGGGGGSSSVPGEKPALSKTPRDNISLTSDNVVDVISNLAALPQEGLQASPLTARSHSQNGTESTGLSPLAQMTYEMMMGELHDYFLGRYGPTPRSQSISDDFGGLCSTGDIVLAESTNSVSLDLQNCRIDAGEANDYLYLTGRLSMTGTDVAEYTPGEYCFESVDATLNVDDLWFREIQNGQLESSLFGKADISTEYNAVCDDQNLSGDFSSSISGSGGQSGYFVMDVDGESFGMYDIDVTAVRTDPTNEATFNVVFDASDLEGSLRIFTEKKLVTNDDMDYPSSGTFGVGTDTENVTFNVRSVDEVELSFTGIPCNNDTYSWQELEQGAIRCN